MSRARALLSSPRLPLVAVIVAIVLSIPALTAGYFLDDYLYIQRLRDGGGSLAAGLDLYRLTAAYGGPSEAIKHGHWPWWFDTSAKVELCRPLSGLLFAVDQRLWPETPFVAHLHSLAWYLLLVVACARLYKLFSSLPDGSSSSGSSPHASSGGLSPATAGLALLLFVLEEGHWQAAGWIANRHSVVAAAPVVLGLVAHVAWRERGWRPGAPLSMLGYAVGLGGGETAVQALMYVVAYELFVSRGRRLVGLVPLASIVVGYFAIYKTLGFGARNHEQYLDPIGEPGRFLQGAITRLPTLLADLFAGFPADLWAPLPVLRTAFVVVGVLATAAIVGLAVLAWPAVDVAARRAVKFFAAGSALSILPGAAGLPGSRLLLVPSIGGAVVLATILIHGGAAVRSRGLAARAAGKVGAAWIVVVHLVLSPIVMVFNFVNMRTIGAATAKMSREAEVGRVGLPASRIDVAVLEAPDLVAMLYPPLVLSLDPETRYRSWWTLSVAPKDHVFRRTGERSFTLTVEDGAFFTGEWEKLFRSSARALRQGDRVELAGLRAEVLTPSEISFEADVPLDDPSLRLLAWKDGGLRRVVPPPIGQSIALRHEKGLLGL